MLGPSLRMKKMRVPPPRPWVVKNLVRGRVFRRLICVYLFKGIGMGGFFLYEITKSYLFLSVYFIKQGFVSFAEFAKISVLMMRSPSISDAKSTVLIQGM